MSSDTGKQTIILVHGLWIGAWALRLMARRLRRQGFNVALFSYSTTRYSVAENADRLAAFAKDIDTQTLHFVGYSLGGLVVRTLLANHLEPRDGRVVTLGTPHQGSRVATFLHGLPLLGRTLGQSFTQGLDGDVPRWPLAKDLGCLAGTLSMGFGLLFAPLLSRPNDGTVMVSEALAEGMAAHRQIPVSHFGFLLSVEAVRQTAAFLATGRFAD